MAPSDKCSYPRCRSRDIWLIHLGKPLCEKHWNQVCDNPPEPEPEKEEILEARPYVYEKPQVPEGGWF